MITDVQKAIKKAPLKNRRATKKERTRI